MRRPQLIKALGGQQTTRRLTDANLKLQHLYLYLALMQSNEEMQRRGLTSGEDIYVRLAKPE